MQCSIITPKICLLQPNQTIKKNAEQGKIILSLQKSNRMENYPNLWYYFTKTPPPLSFQLHEIRNSLRTLLSHVVCWLCDNYMLYQCVNPSDLLKGFARA